MGKYILSADAEEDLIRIHHYGVYKFGMKQADKYFEESFECFERIAENPYAFPSVDYIKEGYRRSVCGSDSIYYRIGEKCVEIMTIVKNQDFENMS